MSHLSKISTRIFDVEILKKTLEDLGLTYKSDEKYKDADNNCYDVNLLVFSDKRFDEPLFGFVYDRNERDYTLVTDMYFWYLDISLDFFMEKLHQLYALNVIIKQTTSDGFQPISTLNKQDGTMQLVVQRWSN
uniref:Uncharacterized protein ycf35 n=1 Tax=Crouania attenuata TaxID=42002 RepID=A0A4D6WQ49_9FLOR|nr:hypothetical protein [Crouania attenuata]